MDIDEKIAQFVSVTDSSDAVARKYLEACAGDVDMAIGMHLENQDAPQAAAAPVTHSHEDLLSPKTYEEVHGVRAPIPQTTGVLIEDAAPPLRVLRSRQLPQTVFDPFQDYSAVGARTAHSSNHGRDQARQKLADIFRPPHDLLFNGTFHEAKIAGQQKKQWLLVNLQDSKEFASQILNRDVWSNYHVKDLIKRCFLFIQIYRISDEGVHFKHIYHIDSYPSVVIIDPRTGEKMMSWGPISSDNFIKEVSEFLANNPYEEESQGEQHAKSVLNLSEESQLEAAIKASLLESKPHNADNHTLVFSDDSDTDYITLSPDKREKMTVDSGVRSVGKSSAHTEGVSSGGRSGKVESANGVATRMTRKRASNETDGEWARGKRMRTNIDPVCVAIDNIELTHEDGLGESRVAINGRGKGGRRRKGKGKAKSCNIPEPTSKDCRSVEEMLAAGSISKEDVSLILFRLPDGTRLQKSFLCNHPVQELLTFLEGQGLKLTEHTVETHFPKRSLLTMDCRSSLKHNKLYPRETVFVSTL